VLAGVLQALAVRGTAGPERTVDALESALARGGLTGEATAFTRLWLAKEFVGVRRLPDAESTFRQVMEGHGRHAANAAKDLALLDLSRGRFRAAADALQGLGTDSLETYWRDVTQGESLLYHARFDEAVRRLTAATENPVTAWSPTYRTGAQRWLAMAQAYSRPADAIRTADDAFARAQGAGESPYPLADCESTRALAFAALGRFDEAEEALARSYTLLRDADDLVDSTHSCVAEVYLACGRGDLHRAAGARSRLFELFLKRNSHGHWLAITAAWLQQASHRAQPHDHPRIDWIDAEDEVLARWREAGPVR
jgi:tetratricopeptide (TPR) repeat protein